MKSRHQTTTLSLGALVLASGMMASCNLPPREAFRRIREEGIVKAIFAPRRVPVQNTASQVATSTDWGSTRVEASATRSANAPKIPTAEMFTGRPGFVYSPYTKKLVNVQSFPAGEQVLCPYTLEPFTVPNYGQGTVAKVTPAPSKLESAPTFGPSVSPKPAPPKEKTEVASNNTLTPPPLPTENSSLPAYGQWVEGRPGFVYSPFARRHQLVDVTGIAPGVEVKCPYSGNTFRVPEMAEPAADSGAKPQEPKPQAQPKPEATPPTKPEAKPEMKPENKPADQPPAPKPEAKAEPKPTTPAPVSTPATMPVAKWVDGKPGLVQSPFGEAGQLVDVTGKEPGSKVLCPFTGKPFIVPAK